MIEGDRVTGVVTQVGIRFSARTVVLTAGTFLDGRIHVGLDSHAGGRAGEAPAQTLSARLKELKLPQGRLKTGTPPRLDGRTSTSRARGAARRRRRRGGRSPAVPVFSFLGDPASIRARSRAGSRKPTPARTRSSAPGFDRQPDVHRPDRRRRPALLPEHRGQGQSLRRQGFAPDLSGARGLTTHEVYPNGISTSLPFESRSMRCVRSPDWRTRDIMRLGYAIEYDYFDPRDLRPSFETRASAGCSSPARSTARPATKRRRPRD